MTAALRFSATRSPVDPMDHHSCRMPSHGSSASPPGEGHSTFVSLWQE